MPPMSPLIWPRLAATVLGVLVIFARPHARDIRYYASHPEFRAAIGQRSELDRLRATVAAV